MNEAFPRAHPSMTDIIGVLNNISIVDINRLQVTATGRRTRPTPETIKLPAKQVFSGHPIVMSDDESSEPDDDTYTVTDDYGSGGGDNDSDGVGEDDEDNGDSESVDGAGDASESDDASEAKSADYGVDGYIFD